MEIKEKWTCKKCGNCCRAFSHCFFNGQMCPDFNEKTNLCNRYKTRPWFCWVDISIVGDEVQQRLCEFYRQTIKDRERVKELENEFKKIKENHNMG